MKAATLVSLAILASSEASDSKLKEPATNPPKTNMSTLAQEKMYGY